MQPKENGAGEAEEGELGHGRVRLHRVAQKLPEDEGGGEAVLGREHRARALVRVAVHRVREHAQPVGDLWEQSGEKSF